LTVRRHQSFDHSRARLSEDYLDSVTINERVPLNGAVQLAAHDPSWASDFVSIAESIRKALDCRVIRLEHVGSTSVPGLVAKPVIDIAMTVADSSDESSYVPALEELGYVLRIREPDWYEHRLLKAPRDQANLHVFSEGCEEMHRMLTFRDWLRVHAADRQLYEEAKRRLAARTWRHMQHYADSKSAIVSEILARALHSSDGA
jgi:GrpB-like predicted nucleotidyltransferase (UPF0157 family)